jgi:predicted porin
MQKKLIAAAVAALVSTGAMAQATVYGRVDIGYNSLDTDTTTAGGVKTSAKRSSTGWNQGALTSSRLGFAISEDLGDGLKAFGNLELGIANAGALNGLDNGADVAAPFTTRTAFVGLSSSMGDLTIGRQTTLADLALQAGSVGAANNTRGALYNDGIKFNNTRSSELITYASPVFAGGLKISAQFADGKADTGAANGVDQHKEVGFLVSYNAGPLGLNVGYSDEEQTTNGAVPSVTAEPKELVFSGSYDLGMAKLYGIYAQGENVVGGIDDRNAFELGVKVPFGKFNFIASIYDGEQDNVNPATADRDLSGFQLGAMYSFSKRTTAYALYGSDKNESQTTAAKIEQQNLAIGIRHDF